MLLPLAAVVWHAVEGGWHGFWRDGDESRTRAALRLTIAPSLLVAAINAVIGTLIAWVLVRDDFPGKDFVNSLIDLPFALPTIVAGLTLLALYGPRSGLGINVAYTRVAVMLALLFVTLPFVVRSVQPVLLELDREMEEAARRWVPATSRSSGASCCRTCAGDHLGRGPRLRARGRRVRLGGADLGQPAVQDRGHLGVRLRVDRERRRERRGSSGRRALMGVSLGVLLLLVASSAWGRRYELGKPTASRATCALATHRDPGTPGGARLLPHVRARTGARLGGLTAPETLHASGSQSLIAAIAVPANTVFGVVCALLSSATDSPASPCSSRLIDLPFAVSPVVVGLSLVLVYGRTGWFGGWLTQIRHPA